MHPKRFALVMGLVFLAMGVLSFIPAFMVLPATGLPPMRLESGYGLFLGFIPMNVLNKIALVIFGAAGILSYSARFTDLPKSISFARWTFVFMAILAVLGMIPETNTLGGYMPLYGNTIWEHSVFALLGLYFGFAFTLRAHTPPQPDTSRPLTH